jgi:hypothetical protein
MRWDWMIVPDATLGEQLLLDTLVPLFIVLIFRINRFNEGPLLEDLAFGKFSWPTCGS